MRAPHARCASDGELCSVAVLLARLLSLLAVALAHVLCELDARGVTETEHGLTAASWLARRRGEHGAGVRRALAGAVVSGAGAYLGGHLAAARKVGSHHHAYDAATAGS